MQGKINDIKEFNGMLRRTIAILVMLAAMAGCSRDPDSSRLIRRRPSDAEIAGVWSGEWRTARNDLSNKCSLTFLKDGKFFGDVVTNLLPREKLEDATGAGSGEWKLMMIDNQWRVNLAWRSPSREKVAAQSEMFAIEENGVITLRVTHGDPDAPDNVIYLKRINE